MKKKKKGQVSMEYIILVGFISFIIIGTLVIAFYYSSGAKDRIRTNQIDNFAKKIISSSESVFYHGEPSKTTISVYLPEGVTDILIQNDRIYITYQASSGLEKISFKSNVPLDGTISSSSGIKRIQISAQEEKVNLGQV
jgi:uncharacterized protein (UPF0333 family)